MKEAGITVATVTKQPVSATVAVPGRVVPTQDGAAHVGTVIEGRVHRLFVSEGAYVRKGAPLAELEAANVGELHGEYLRASAELDQRKAALGRQERLANEGIGAQRLLEEARSAYQQARAALQTVESKLRAAGISPMSADGGSISSRVTLRSPISGMVARRSIVIGEYLEPSSDAFEIINTATVWVDAQVASHSAGDLAIGGTGFIRTSDGQRSSGKIIFIAPFVDPDSRTVTVRIEVDNRKLGLRPEMFVTVEFERSVTEQALVVPLEAVEQEADRTYVYREHEPNTFIRVEVETGERTEEKVVIAKGIQEGEKVAVSGIFYLRSARQQGELAEHHH
jgi:cobalt-zinc-cadmium efflux system membrane fusion protein